MVDFSKKLKNQAKQIVTDPIKIYESLDRQTEKVGPLRKPQQKVLQEWFASRLKDKNVILKLNTGAGKTLAGLLILESKRRQNHGVEIFLCNNSNLINQTIHQANLFGIFPVEMDENNNIPTEVINGEKLLITSVQKVFNGKSVFEHVDSFEIDTMVIDDAHASAELIKNSCTMTISKNKNAQLYTDLFNLLSDGLSSQGLGTFEDLKNSRPTTSYEQAFLPVPYWTWIDKCEDITRLISTRSDVSTEIKFVWPLLRDCLDMCNCIVSSKAIEITPIKYPLNFYTSFVNANQRILMSATTASDSVLINDLDIDKQSVLHPLIDSEEKWSGEKMVIIPSLISDSLNRSEIVRKFGVPCDNSFGTTVIVPSYYKTKDWEAYGSTIGKNTELQKKLTKFHSGIFDSTLVLVNRYDGIDLPDNETRILILDSLPNATSLYDKYMDSVVPDSSESLLRRAQKIEQGMGRSVRADTDYSVIIFTGPDLVHFIRNPKLQKYFSNQTLNQIKLGVDISEEAKKESRLSQLDNKSPLEVSFEELLTLIKQSLGRDADWKEYYQEQMAMIDYSQYTPQDLDLIVAKSRLMKMAINPMIKIEEFNAKARNFINNYCDSHKEQGWYLQLMAQVNYRVSKNRSRAIQIEAYKKNNSLLLPDNMNPVEKMDYLVAQKRLNNIIAQIKTYGTYENLYNSIEKICSNLSFNTTSKYFEESMDELGKILGFITERPDKYYKKGPDHLWSVKDDLFFVIEDKSEVSTSREKIYKTETGQVNNSIEWFKKNYSGARFESFLIIPTLYPDPAGGLNDNVRIIRNKSLKALKSNLINFTREFKDLDFNSLSAEKVAEFIKDHHFEVNDFSKNYSEPHS
jgi:replicative superfamily II helicase